MAKVKDFDTKESRGSVAYQRAEERGNVTVTSVTAEAYRDGYRKGADQAFIAAAYRDAARRSNTTVALLIAFVSGILFWFGFESVVRWLFA